MERLILITFGILVCSLSYGADWKYATSSTNGEDYFIDKSFYKYDYKNQTVDVWDKSENKKSFSDETYTSSKSLTRYSCSNKSSKTLAAIQYNENGSAKYSSSTPQKDFTLIFPDTIAETLWHTACDSKGRGFKFREYKPKFVDLETIGMPSNKEVERIKNSKTIPDLHSYDSLDDWQIAIFKYYGIPYPEDSAVVAIYGKAPYMMGFSNLYHWVYAMEKYGEKAGFVPEKYMSR